MINISGHQIELIGILYICRYAAELHLVHLSDSGTIAVVSMLYELGDADPFISKVEYTSQFFHLY